MPLFSVIIPNHHRAAEAVRALYSLKAQTVHDWEACVLFAPGAGDFAHRTLKDIDRRIRLISLQGGGDNPSLVRNAGILQSRGELIAYLDDDDAYHPGHLSTMLGLFQSSPSVEFVFSGSFFRAPEGRIIETTPDFYRLWDPQLQVIHLYTTTSTFAHRRNLAVRWNEEEPSIHEDWDLCMRLAGNNVALHPLLPRKTVDIYKAPGTRSRNLKSRLFVTWLRLESERDARALLESLDSDSNYMLLMASFLRELQAAYQRRLRHDPPHGLCKKEIQKLSGEIGNFYRRMLVYETELRRNKMKSIFSLRRINSLFCLGNEPPPFSRYHLERYLQVYRELFANTNDIKQRIWREACGESVSCSSISIDETGDRYQ